jgi:phosphomannomutase/phosphoglucomutase
VQEENALIGGEFSGHIFFNDRWNGFDDGLYAAVRLLEILCEQEMPTASLNQLISEFRTSSYTPEILVPVPETAKFELMDTLINKCPFADATINKVDGMRVEYEQGWGLVRSSNTTPNLTLRFEAEDEIQLEEIKRRFRKELKPFINHIEDYI